MNCSNCGKELVEGAKFCLECGTKIAQSESNICTKCGTEFKEGAKFCLECGAKRGENSDQKENMILVCGSCGAIPKEGKKFCAKCGANIGETGVMKALESVGNDNQTKIDDTGPQTVDNSQTAKTTSEINNWAFTIPSFLFDLDVDFKDEEFKTSLKTHNNQFGFEITCLNLQKIKSNIAKSNIILRPLFNAVLSMYKNVNSLTDFINVDFLNPDEKEEKPNILSHKNIVINGIDAHYYQCTTKRKVGNVFNEVYAICACFEINSSYFRLDIFCQKPKREELEEQMDSFIHSFEYLGF